MNALVAATGVLVPMQCEYYALEGLSPVGYRGGIRAKANPNLEIEGLLRTMYDARNSLSRDVSRQLIQYFGEKFTAPWYHATAFGKRQAGLPVMMYDRGLEVAGLSRSCKRNAKAPQRAHSLSD